MCEHIETSTTFVLVLFFRPPRCPFHILGYKKVDSFPNGFGLQPGWLDLLLITTSLDVSTCRTKSSPIKSKHNH